MTETDFKIRRPPRAAVTPPPGSLSAECAALLENRGPLRILDIGCGRAKYRQFVIECGHKYVGLDLSSRQSAVRGDAHALPFGDSQFDAAFLFGVLQYSLNPLLVFEEARRVMRPAGTLTGCIAFLEPAVWGGLMQLSAAGLAILLRQAGLRLEYIWPSWDVFEAIACAVRQGDLGHAAGRDALRKVESAQKLYEKVFQDTLDFSGAIFFHAEKSDAPPRYPAA